MSSPVITAPHTKWARAIGIAVGASLIVAVVVLAFLWPSITSSIKSFPIAVTGDATQVSSFTEALDKNAEGRFDVTTLDSRSEAVDRIESRDIYGAVVLGQKPEVLTASAGGTVQTQVMGQLQSQLQMQVNSLTAAGVQAAVAKTNAAAEAGQLPPAQAAQIIEKALSTTPATVKLTDVVPLASTDSRGVGFAAASFPMVLGGMLGGILISVLVAGVWRRFAAILAYSVIAGFGLTAILQPWFGILQGDFLVNGAAMALTLLGTGALIVGATAVFGRIGIAVGSVITMFIGNPISAATQPLQFLPAPWGAIGQFFVPGASTTLLRDLSYFPDANALQSWLVLAGWALVGVVLMFVGHFRSQEVVHVESAIEKPMTGSAPVIATA
ncbi:ABC transporter permease [Rathayibacter sp. YIM 133350]|uniref:ABC transporter permease n=1 Tax=Rathayibacter sp. YIM 133350 TaxID=3131992 RepID=UPI00307FB389